MKLLKLAVLFTIIALSSNVLFANDKNHKCKHHDSDSSRHYDVWEESGKPMEMFRGYNHPTIEVFWGVGKPSIKSDVFDGTFTDVGLVEVRLGNIKKRSYCCDKDVLDFQHGFFFAGNMSNNIPPDPGAKGTKIETNTFRFGVGRSKGLGYQLGESSDIVFYNSGAMVWTKIKFKDTARTPGDQDRIDTYGDAFRFGTMMEAGAKIQLFYPLAVTLAYERAVVYPRHLFWYWLASEATEGIGNGIIDEFVKHIAKAAPKAAPIAYFVLQNGFSYGMYELRKKHMNWPVTTDRPLMYDSYKVGLSFVF